MLATLPPARLRPVWTADRDRPSGVILLLRLEGVAAGVAGLMGFFALSGSWTLLALGALAPDLAMLGYVLGPGAGARAYNLAHTYIAPAALAVAGLALGPMPLALACLWVAHIGLDRALGYGLKHASGFGDTHLGRIGRDASA